MALSIRILRLVWCLGGVALLLALVREPVLDLLRRAQPLARADLASTTSAWFEGDFGVGRAYPTTTAGMLAGNVPTIGSWIDSDQWQGHAATVWFAATQRRIAVAVAGYPQHRGCGLWVEVRDAAGAVTRIDCRLGDAREQWQIWEIHLPADAQTLRVVAEDRASDVAGWLAFSHPFTTSRIGLTTAYQHAQVYATLALALTLIWGPGLGWLSRRRTMTSESATIALLGAGPGLLAAMGVAIWIASGSVRPQLLGFLLVLGVWLTIGRAIWRRAFVLPSSRGLRCALALSGLIALAALAKSTYSRGPQGELFRGTVSRNLALGDRIDSRFGFYTVQAAARHLNPTAREVEELFFPWTFFSRGQLAGLAAVPVVMATGGQPAPGFPEQSWTPFDPTGFAAFRITLITLASMVFVAFFALLTRWLDEGWALLATGLVALSPFGVHEVMFTWPKWVATAWIAASLALVHARRPVAGGLTLGIGFLFHPIALLWAPWVGLWACGRAWKVAGVPAFLATGVRFTLGTAVLVVPWMLLGALLPHQASTPLAGQGGFLRYWVLADWHTATWQTWWKTRWMNFANTFLPLHVMLHPPSVNHFKFGSTYEPSTTFVKFGNVWWVSLPFALGLLLWAVSLPTIVRAARKLLAATVIFVLGPAVFITAYWGMDPTGLMRECGHPLFLAIVALVVVVAARERGWLRRFLAHPALPWLQLPETLLMLWLTTLAHRISFRMPIADLDPLALLVNALALGAAAWVLSRERVLLRRSEALASPVPPVAA